MQFILFLFYVIGISFLGVASPGPLTFLTISSSYNNKNAGVLISLGHAIVEAPLVFLISLGVIKFLNSEIFRITTSLLGSVVLIFLGIRSMKDTTKIEKETYNIKTPLLLAGSLATVSNPYFFIWWATIGAALIMKSLEFGRLALFAFLAIHLLCDFSWYSFISHIIYKTKKLISQRVFRTILKVCGVFIITFGLLFIKETINLLLKSFS